MKPPTTLIDFLDLLPAEEADKINASLVSALGDAADRGGASFKLGIKIEYAGDAYSFKISSNGTGAPRTGMHCIPIEDSRQTPLFSDDDGDTKPPRSKKGGG